MLEIARRQRKPEIEAEDLPVDAIKRKPQLPRSDPIAPERKNEASHEAFRERDDRVLREDRLDEANDLAIGRWGRKEEERLGHLPERLVEASQELRLEARREGRARRIDQRADALEAEAPQRLSRRRREAQGDRRTVQARRASLGRAGGSGDL